MGRNRLLIGLFAFLVLPMIVYAQDRQPSECFVSKPNGQVKILSCVGVGTTLSDFAKRMGVKKKVTKNMCLFYKGKWQRGSLVTANESVVGFLSTTACDRGVNVTKTSMTTDVYGPAVTVCGFSGGKHDASSCGYCGETESGCVHSWQQAMDEMNALKKGKLNCFLKAKASSGSTGEPSICNSDPTKAGYCDLISMKKNSKYNGRWWVQYKADGKKKPRVCAGGISLADMGTLNAEFGDTDLYGVLKKPTDLPVLSKDSLPVEYILQANIDPADPDSDEAVVSCLHQKKLNFDYTENNMMITECAKECSAEDDGNCSTNNYYEKINDPNTGHKTEKGICFNENGRWYIAAKRAGSFPGKVNGIIPNHKVVRQCYQIEVRRPR